MKIFNHFVIILWSFCDNYLNIMRLRMRWWRWGGGSLPDLSLDSTRSFPSFAPRSQVSQDPIWCSPSGGKRDKDRERQWERSCYLLCRVIPDSKFEWREGERLFDVNQKTTKVNMGASILPVSSNGTNIHTHTHQIVDVWVFRELLVLLASLWFSHFLWVHASG